MITGSHETKMAAQMCGRCARKLQHLRTPWHSSVRLLCAPSSSLSLESEDNRYMEASSAKKRDPLAVLKILASTVKPVPNLSNPEFVEDIFLLPRSKDKQVCQTLRNEFSQQSVAI
ncbi:PREDICTED: uncharacterized protein LOC107329953 [Acropora digitifera]|uniref:uncharacterized protein LOC107329953 n=1 Tax=Acropora digitifera TaxID=70779 RepID=UPI00077A8A02|nr:PREDICTED: uncharacterized protein LOC107329953 [Acropora digitifera]